MLHTNFYGFFYAGYQFDYVFDWTILKYPQIGSNPRMRVGFCKLCWFGLLLFGMHSVFYLTSSVRHGLQSERTTAAAGHSIDNIEKISVVP